MPFKDSRAISMAALVLLSVCAFPARAGGSLFVDDATITPAGQCQVESWTRAYFPGQEFTAVPACNIANSEFGLGVSHYSHPQSAAFWSVGGKRVFRDAGAHPWGIGLSAGATWDSGADHWANWSVNVPVSVALDTDRNLLLHANVGWINHNGRQGGVTGGVGLEIAMGDAWAVLAEVHDDRSGTTTTQMGVRRALGEAASLDLLVGQDRLDSGPWATVGYNISFSR